MTTDHGLPSLRDVSKAQWEVLAQRRIFFGHQSVGGNIVSGITELLAEHPEIRLKVVETRDLARNRAPGFYHALVGRNEHPVEKLDDFVSLASSGFGSESGVAMVKLCYVDAHTHTDAAALFDDYRRRVADFQSRHPALRILHFTMPLTIVENWKGRLMAAARGFATQRDRNLVRHRYNELMRRAFGDTNLFDLARMEATRSDGGRATFHAGRETVPMLAAEHTDDGGHLNARARRLIAEQLLISLAR